MTEETVHTNIESFVIVVDLLFLFSKTETVSLCQSAAIGEEKGTGRRSPHQLLSIIDQTSYLTRNCTLNYLVLEFRTAYKKGLYERCFELIREYDLLAEEGIIIAEHNVRDKLAEELYGFEIIKEISYGTVAISIYG